MWFCDNAKNMKGRRWAVLHVFTESFLRVSVDSAADQRADDATHHGRAERKGTRMVSAMVMVVDGGRGRRRRWRRMVVMPVMRMVHRRRRRGAVVVESAARCREAGSREGQAGEDRSEGFQGLVVHITPSLSFCFGRPPIGLPQQARRGGRQNLTKFPKSFLRA